MSFDLRTALRQLRRAPATAAAAILTLAVGTGATTAVFSFVTAVMSATAPTHDMERMVGLWSHNRNESETKGLVSPADFVEWSRRARSFETIAAWRSVAFNVSGASAAVRARAVAVTSGYMEAFGWQPAFGRLLTTADATPGAPRVIVLSQLYWQNELGGRTDVIGHTLKLDGVPATIIGVLPRMPAVGNFFVPLSVDRIDDRNTRTLFVMARLRPGVTLESARHEMQQIGAVLEREFDTNRGWAVNTRPLQEEFVGPQARLVFALLSATVAMVLLIGCVNIANLLLARGVARRGEMAVRLALGAGGWRIVRQLLVECAVLALLGAMLSLAVSRWTIKLLTTLGPVDSPWIENGGLNPRVLLLTALVSLVATFLAGLAPALAARRGSLVSALYDAGRSGATNARRTTRTLVSAQVAVAVTLLVMAGLANRTLIALERLELGFDLDHVLTASVTLPDAMTPDRASVWIDEMLTRARQLPGVITAGATSRLPLAGGRWNANRGLEIEGQSPFEAEGRWAVDYVITPGFMEALRIAVVEGRPFTPGDGDGAPLVALVNQAMARRFWPGRSPVGTRLRQGGSVAEPWRTIVGVVADVRNDDADQPPLPYLYVPLAQQPVRSVSVALRTTGDPASLAAPLRRAVSDFDADHALYDIRTMREVWEADLRGSRILIEVMSVLALIALGLAGLGVWGVAAQAVNQRTREIGVRMALGADAARVGRLIAWQGLMPIVAGLAIGLVGGLALGRVMRSILFQVTPFDPITLIVTMAALALVGALATLGPALRAARLNVVVALRTE